MKLKDDVEVALKSYLGVLDVQRKNKSVKVRGNSKRTDCDTVPAIRNRDYSNDLWNDENNYTPGICIHADNGEIAVNYPEQHIGNGATKDWNTAFNFKKCVLFNRN